MSKQKPTLAQAKELVLQQLQLLGSPRHELINETGLTLCKFEAGTYGSFIEIGYQFYRGGKVSHFFHANIPKTIKAIGKMQDQIALLLNSYPDLEIYFDGDHTFDWESGKVFDRNHKVIKLKYTQGAVKTIEQEIKVLNGEGKYSYLHKRSPIDYDFIFQTL